MCIRDRPKNALVKQYRRVFELDSVELEFTEDALEAVAEQALLRGTGARGLRAILEEVLLEVMYDLPSRTDIGRCVIDRSVVLDRNSHKGDSYIVSWTLVAFPWLPSAPTTTIALPDSSGTAEIEADSWQPAGFLQVARPPERYELEYPYTVAAGSTQVLMPGSGRYLFQYNDPVWVNQDVQPTLAAVP